MYPADKLAALIPVTDEEIAITQAQDVYRVPAPRSPSSYWLSKHPIMLQPHESPHSFFVPRPDLRSQICRNLDPMSVQGVARSCRNGRDWHYAHSRQHIREAIRNGQVLYTVASLEGLYGGHPYGDGGQYPKRPSTPTKSTRRLIKTGHLNEDVTRGFNWFSFLHNIPENCIVFASRADAGAYAHWAAPEISPIIVSLVSMGQLPDCRLSRVEICYNAHLNGPPAVSCARMDRNQAVFLGIEMFYSGNNGKGWEPLVNVFCETPFDAPTLPRLKSPSKIRQRWHQNFLLNLTAPEKPTLTDLCNWIVGYCSYYQEHKGGAGRKKAEAIRDLMQLVSLTLRPRDKDDELIDPSIEEFLNYRPYGPKRPSLLDLINGRRDKKSGKNSWGGERVQEAFLEPKEELRHHKGCGY